MAAQAFTGHHEASWRLSASQGITALLKASRGFMASLGTPQRPGVHGDSRTSQRSPCVTAFSYTTDFSYSFSYSFSYKIFPEQLCFSIDLAVSSLL